jgi:hypothetical protein
MVSHQPNHHHYVTSHTRTIIPSTYKSQLCHLCPTTVVPVTPLPFTHYYKSTTHTTFPILTQLCRHLLCYGHHHHPLAVTSPATYHSYHSPTITVAMLSWSCHQLYCDCGYVILQLCHHSYGFTILLLVSLSQSSCQPCYWLYLHSCLIDLHHHSHIITAMLFTYVIAFMSSPLCHQLCMHCNIIDLITTIALSLVHCHYSPTTISLATPHHYHLLTSPFHIAMATSLITTSLITTLIDQVQSKILTYFSGKCFVCTEINIHQNIIIKPPLLHNHGYSTFSRIAAVLQSWLDCCNPTITAKASWLHYHHYILIML